MSAQAQGETPSRSGTAFWNDPQFRSIFFQLLVVAAVVGFGWYLFSNTSANLERQGIASGFGFLNSTAGFGIIQTLIEYSEESTYGRAFWVGLLNTLLMSGIGVVLATIVGFTVGVARLSPNWLISRMATVYIETLRNIPLLLQIFFWYFAVLRAVPGPRQSINIGDAFFINNRGLYSPSPIFGDGFGLVVICFAAAIVGIIVLSRWAHKRQQATGEQFPVFLTSLGLFFGLPVLGLIVASLAYGGIPLTLDYPALKGFNFKGGMVMIPEFVALLLALSAYTAAFIAEIVRAGILAVSHGHARDHPAADQPVPEPDQEFLAGRGDRLSGTGFHFCRHGAEPDRSGGRGDRHHDGHLFGAQPFDFGPYELVQQENGTGGEVMR
jgi:general L-amino acid transport system permease protein